MAKLMPVQPNGELPLNFFEVEAPPTRPIEAQQVVERPMNEDRIRELSAILQKYKEGKATLENRIISNSATGNSSDEAKSLSLRLSQPPLICLTRLLINTLTLWIISHVPIASREKKAISRRLRRSAALYPSYWICADLSRHTLMCGTIN